MELIVNVPCPAGILHFLLANFEQLLVLRSTIFRQGEHSQTYPVDYPFVISDALSLIAIFK
jgi:hypothetical protein